MIYDAVVVGSGPAGGQCARELAAKGHQTLLVERQPSFEANSFSTAGAPLEILEDFALPESIVGAWWRHLRFVTSTSEHVWPSDRDRGVVLDFAKLRRFLAHEVTAAGSEVWLGHPYRFHKVGPNRVDVVVGERFVSTRFLVDATGTERKILGQNPKREELIEGTGIEELIEVPSFIYERWSDALSFFVGSWMPRGYAWVFPMEPNRLKVGVGRYHLEENSPTQLPTYRQLLERLIQRVTYGMEYTSLNRHGKRLSYRRGRRDVHVDGPLVAVGDAISTLNPLAFEGIRHGMWSGRFAAEAIDLHLRGDRRALKRFPVKIGRYCGLKWPLCEKLMERAYRENDDVWYETALRAYAKLSTDQMHRFCFDYSLKEMIRFVRHLRRERKR